MLLAHPELVHKYMQRDIISVANPAGVPELDGIFHTIDGLGLGVAPPAIVSSFVIQSVIVTGVFVSRPGKFPVG